jgi:hypothetical protein
MTVLKRVYRPEIVKVLAILRHESDIRQLCDLISQTPIP